MFGNTRVTHIYTHRVSFAQARFYLGIHLASPAHKTKRILKSMVLDKSHPRLVGQVF